MPNLEFSINEAGGSGGRTAIVGMRALHTQLSLFIQDLVTEAAKAGANEARAQAPRNKTNPTRHTSDSIADSIRVSQRSYVPGGLGGGGTYQVELIADGAIAPHLQFVYEGTASRIYPAHGNLLVFEKHGEGLKYRPSVRGQKPQTEWWTNAQARMEEYISARVRSSGLGDAIRR